jgi:hypothetical protein
MRKTTIFSFLVTMVIVACTSQKHTLHIADTSLFAFDSVHTDEEDEALVEFLDYSTYFHIISDSDFVEKQNRPGVLLSSKNTAYVNWNGQAAFGKPGDTCWINYRSHNEQVTLGRSAAISVFNFFNNEALENTPDEYFMTKELSGSIKLHKTAVPFHFYQRKQEGWKSKGWVVIDKDSFFLKPAVITSGTTSRASKENKNLQLVRQGNEEPIAAIDFYRKPRAIYIRKNLEPKQRLLASAYIFVLLSYLR